MALNVFIKSVPEKALHLNCMDQLHLRQSENDGRWLVAAQGGGKAVARQMQVDLEAQ
jgi:hypothetical protein